MATRDHIQRSLRAWLDRLRGQGLGAVLVRGAGGSAGVHAAGGAFAVATHLVLARLLGVEHYGYYVFAFSWAIVLNQLSRLGFQNSLIRFTAAYRTEGYWDRLRGLVRSSALLVAGTAGLTALALIGGAWLLADRMPPALLHTLILAALLVVPLALIGNTEGLLRGYRQPVRGSLPFRVLLHGFTLVLVAVLAATVGLTTATAAMACTLLAGLGALAVGLWWCRQALAPEVAATPASGLTPYWLRASVPVLAMTGMNMLMKQTDTIMLGALTDTDASGLYFPVARVSEVAVFGLLSVNAVIAPLISELNIRAEPQRLQRLLRLAAAGTTGATLVLVAILGYAGEAILGLFGAAFRDATPALLILLAGQAVNSLCGPVGLMMTMTGHQDRASLILIVAVGVNIALNAMLIPVMGLNGAAIATAASVVFWNVWMLAEVVRRLGVDPSAAALLRRPWAKGLA